MHKSSYYYCATFTLLASLSLCKPTLADNSDMDRMRWLIGVWVSEPNAAGTVHEYVFEPVFNGELMGTQIEVNKEGKTFHHAVRTIHEQDGKVIVQDDSFKGDMSPIPSAYPVRSLESQDATHVNFTDLKLIRTGKNSMTMEFTQHSQGGASKTTDVELKRTMVFTRTN